MIYRSKSEIIKKVIAKGQGFTAFLDDSAQITGPEVRLIEEKNLSFPIKDCVTSDYGEKSGAAVKGSDDFPYDEIFSENAGLLIKEGYALTCGRSMREAETAMEVLEKACFVLLAGAAIGGVKPLSLEDSRLMRDNYLNNYSKAEEGKARVFTGRSIEGICAEELELREKLVSFGNMLVEEGLVSGTWGNLSVRIDENHMLVTPSGITYSRLTPGDMVRVRIDDMTHEGDLKPTSEKILHAEIYRRRPDVRAIIHTHQTGASVFAACEKDLGEIKTAAYALPGTDDLATFTADALGENSACIMAHHGMCAAGSTLEEAFRICIDLESRAMEAIGI